MKTDKTIMLPVVPPEIIEAHKATGHSLLTCKCGVVWKLPTWTLQDEKENGTQCPDCGEPAVVVTA